MAEKLHAGRWEFMRGTVYVSGGIGLGAELTGLDDSL